MDNKMVLLTLTGPDRTGIIAAVTGHIAEAGARIRDIEQSVTQYPALPVGSHRLPHR